MDVKVDTAETGAITYTYTYTLAYHGLVHTDGNGWTMTETSYVKNNGKTIYTVVAE